jgi:hypothetical protein
MEHEILSPEEVDRRLQEICSVERGGVPPGDLYEATRLFYAMKKCFQTRRGEQILGFRGLEDWIKDRKELLGVKRSHIYNYAKIGQWLVPKLEEMRKDPKEDLQKLVTRALPLADLASKGKLTEDILNDSFDMKGVDVQEKVDLLLGKEPFWAKDILIKDHTTAQAVLLWLGDSEGYDTYAAHKSKKYKDKELGDIANLEKLPEIMKAFEDVDVIWLARDPNAPAYLFEIEHTTGVTRGLRRMFPVPYLNAKYFIIGPKHSRQRFESQMATEPFKAYAAKCRFHSYDELRILYRKTRKFRQDYWPFFN